MTIEKTIKNRKYKLTIESEYIESSVFQKSPPFKNIYYIVSLCRLWISDGTKNWGMVEIQYNKWGVNGWIDIDDFYAFREHLLEKMNEFTIELMHKEITEKIKNLCSNRR